MKKTNRIGITDYLTQSGDEYKIVFDNSPIGIVFFDKEGEVINANQSAMRIFGIPKLEEVIGINIFDDFNINYIKNELLEQGLIKVQFPLNFDMVRELGVYNPKHSGFAFFDLSIFVIDSGFLMQIQDITEIKQTEKALKESEEKYRHWFEDDLTGDFIATPEGKLLECNSAFLDIYGFANHENAIQSNISEFNPTSWIELIAILKKEHKIKNRETLLQRPNGKRFHIVTNVVGIFNDSNELIQVKGYVFDDTERKKAGEELRQAHDNLEVQVQERTKELSFERQRLFDVLETLPVIIGLFTPDYHVVFANRAFRKRFGEAQGRHCYEYIFGCNKPCPWCEIYRVLETGKPYHWEFTGSDGSIIDTYDFPFTDVDGSHLILEMNVDITKQRQTEEKLRKNERRLKLAMDMAKLGYWEYDVESDMFTFDNWFYKLYGTTVEHEGSSKMSSEEYAQRFLPPEESPWVEEEIEKALKTDNPNFFSQKEHTIIRADGEKRFIVVRFGVIKDDKGHTIKTYGANQDITELKKTEEKLKETIQELKRSNEELQSFAYITSHDLQEPLRTIASFAQLIERRYKDQLDQDADEFIGYIVDGASRMKEMIQGLLDYSRVGTQEHEFKEFKSGNVLNYALSNLRSAISENGAKVTHDELPVIFADEDQIIRVFQNLIGNALKFRREGVKPKIHISARKERNEYIFSVSDNGIGLEEQYSDKIFEVFKRLHAIGEYQGAGIGLAIVKRIINRHEGRIWVKSELGKSSTFYFTIPIKNE